MLTSSLNDNMPVESAIVGYNNTNIDPRKSHFFHSSIPPLTNPPFVMCSTRLSESRTPNSTYFRFLGY
jgi:hypothetical protein